MYTEVFPSRLKKARDFAGVSQYDVAKALKISQPTYAGYETGRREPGLEMLALLSKLFDVKTDWLLGLTSESELGSLTEVLQNRERERILKKLQKEAELSQKVWGA